MTEVFSPAPTAKPNSHPLTVTALCVVAIGALVSGPLDAIVSLSRRPVTRLSTTTTS